MTDTIIETFEEHKRILKREFERGFEEGGKEMNRKWVYTWEESILEFIEKIDYYLETDDCDPIAYFIKLKEEYEKKLK